MAVFVVAQIEIHDPVAWRRYAERVGATLEGHEVQVLASDDAPLALEGEWFGPRTVILRFPTREEALAWYRSAEYQEASRFRIAAATSAIALVAAHASE
jgi:uncharacterized protein (DUF1330 family)